MGDQYVRGYRDGFDAGVLEALESAAAALMVDADGWEDNASGWRSLAAAWLQGRASAEVGDHE